jgi:hypothetical protein
MKHPTKIRLNLWTFLLRLRFHGYHDYLWCDAICIDQGNDYERNHQVQLMFQIYRKAHSVLVWLGEENHDSSRTLQTISLLSHCKEWALRQAYLTERAALWQGLLALSRRRYWTRIWIVQEITVARRLELLCGGEKVPWSTFARACTFPPDLWTPWSYDLWTPLGVADEQQQIMRRSAGREVRHSTMCGLIRSQKCWPMEIESLETLSKRYKKSECEDRRDKIFALFSIAKEVNPDRPFTVDYTKDIEETFISLVAWVASGPIWMGFIIDFARVVADGLDLKWRGYSLESTIESDDQRSPPFFKWVSQPLEITLWGHNLGKWSFQRKDDLMWAQIRPGAFDSEPILVYLLPLSDRQRSFEPYFDLLALKTSNVLLACQNDRVVTRAYYQFHGHKLLPQRKLARIGARYQSSDQRLPGESFVPSVFEQMEVGYSWLKLQNVAQFMEILLDKLDPGVWRQPPRIYGGGLLGGGGMNFESSGDRDLKVVLKNLKIKGLISLTGMEEEDDSEDSDEDESLQAGFERLQAESEALAKPRVRKPPIEKPRRRRLQNNSSLRISEEGRFLDPFCERSVLANDFETLGTPPTSLKSSLVSASDVTQQICMPSEPTPMCLG